MKSIIIFGASGDTGSYLVNYLIDKQLNKYFRIIASGRRDRPNDLSKSIDYIKLDIQNKGGFHDLPRNNVAAVVHLAGMMPARMEGYSPYPYIETNILGTLNILEYCRQVNAEKILFAQSFGDIKDQAEKDLVLKHDTVQSFSYVTDHTVYVISKNTVVQLIEHYQQQYGIKSFIFRMPTIYLYSPIDYYYVDGVKRKIGYRIIIDMAKEGAPLEIWGDSLRRKDMIYVKDFCKMLYLAIISDRERGYFNVGTGIGTTLDDQVRGMARVFNPLGKKSEIVYCPEKPNAPEYIMDITNAKEELGYEPEWPYERWLADFKKMME